MTIRHIRQSIGDRTFRTRTANDGPRLTGETLQRRNHLIKLRDLLTCQMCQKIAPEPELEVDHIIPIWKDGEDEPDNLQTLCKACHESKTIDEGSRKTKKKTFYFDENGWKVFDS